jgi:molybdate/tungstate transport system substrate-binding protein
MKSCTLCLSLVLVVASAGCGVRKAEPTELRVLIAGSLMVPFDELESAFEEEHAEVDVLMEGHGSIQCVRQVTELEQLVDVVAVADAALIPVMMYERLAPETGEPYASWNVRFATNELGIAYTSQSAYADEIDEENWHEIISRPGVLLGLSDPRFDACGYRALMAVQLDEKYYGDAGTFSRVFGERLGSPLRLQALGAGTAIIVPEVLQPQPESDLILRGSSVRLLGLLDSGDVDYAFEYRSVAAQHGLRFRELPDEIDLGDQALGDYYSQVVVRLDYQRFATVKPEFAGAPIEYGITIPSNAPNPELAAEFVAFLLGASGQAVMERNEHPMILPPVADNPDALPAALQPLTGPLH